MIEVQEAQPIDVKIIEDLFERETNSNESVNIILPDGRRIAVWGDGSITIVDKDGVGETEVFPRPKCFVCN